MEADICEESVSVFSAANLTDEKVSDTIDCANSHSAVSVTDQTVEEVNDCDDDDPQNNDDGLSNNEEGAYYEVISADGSVGGDDIGEDNGAIGNPEERINLTNTAGLPSQVSSSSVDRSHSEPCSFVDLPFVPKFEFPLDPSPSENVSNYGAFHINRFISDNIPKPDKNFTLPPPNFKPLLDIKPLFDSVPGAVFNPHADNPTLSSKQEIVSTAPSKLCEITSRSRVVDPEFKNLTKPSKKELVVDWVDENGDPLPGAFDYVKPQEEREVSVENARVEYVFSVKEKKEVPIDSNEPCVLNSGFLIGQNVLHKNVPGNLGVHLGLPSGITRNAADGDEEKKLYEASKSGAEYKAAVQAVTASSSTASSSVSRIIPEKEIGKKDRLPRFRRNRFSDIRKEDDPQDEPTEVQAQKSAEEVALESQAVTEILKEVQRGAARAKEVGALGWQKCPIPVTNKTFLRNTLVSTLREPYRPPSKRGRFHVGLKTSEDGGKHHKSRDDDRSSSSRSSRSRSSSRSHSSSYSRSRSGSSYTDEDRSGHRDKRGHFSQRGRGQHQYYDEAWAAYSAHYGYPWYGPEAFPMFYGPEGWPMDPYAAVYYGDPQAWMEYEAYYGPPNFGPRGRGRGFRGRGRGDRGRGRGGFEGDFQGYNFGARNPREYSRSRSRSERSRSWSRDLSRSRSRGGSAETRKRSHSASQNRERQSSRHTRSKGRSLRGESGERNASDAETSEKKKKKKKKKKKHKKVKKSKHSHKGEDNKDSEKKLQGDVNELETAKISDDDNQGTPEEEWVENDLAKKGNVAKLAKRKDHTKYKSGEKDEKEDTKNVRTIGRKIKERTYEGKVREDVSGKKDLAKSKSDRETVNEQLSSPQKDEQAMTVREKHETGTRKRKETFEKHEENKHKGINREDGVDTSTREDLVTTKINTGDSCKDASSNKRQVDRKGSTNNDSRVITVREKMSADTESRSSSQVKQITAKQRPGCSSEFDKDSGISGQKYKYDEDRGNFMYDKRDGNGSKDKRDGNGSKDKREHIGAKVDRKGGSRERKTGNVNSHGDIRGRTNEDGIKYKQRGRTYSDRSNSCDSGRSNDGVRRSSKDGHKYNQHKDVAGRNRRSSSNDSARKSRMVDNYSARKDITQRDDRSGFHHDGKKPGMGGHRDGRSIKRGDSYDGREGNLSEFSKQKIQRDKQGENNKTWGRDCEETISKIDRRYKEGRSDSSLVTKDSRKLDNAVIKRSKSSNYNESDGRSGTTEREMQNINNKEKNIMASRQKILGGREGRSDQKITGLNKDKDLQDKRHRSANSDKTDDSFDAGQPNKIIDDCAVGTQRPKIKSSGRKEVNKEYEDESISEGKQNKSHGKGDPNKIQSDEKPSVDQIMKGGNLKKRRERTENKIQEGSEWCEENTLPEQLKHKRVVKTTQVNKKSGLKGNKSGIELGSQSSTKDSNEHTDVSASQKYSDVTNRTGTTDKDRIEENTDNRSKDDSKGVKRKKKIIKKQVGSKKIKAGSARETRKEKLVAEGSEKLITEGGEKLVAEEGGETRTTEKQLGPGYYLNKESEERAAENILDAAVECSK